jgi:hypothetical protein
VQQPQVQPPRSAALRRELAEAQAALAAVGGTHTRRVQPSGEQNSGLFSGPVRPLIRRQSLGSRAGLEQLATAAAAGAPARGRAGAGGGRSRPGPSGVRAADSEDEAYRARLPASMESKAAGLDAQLSGGRGGTMWRQPSGGALPEAGEEGEESGEEERRSSPIVELSLLLAECVQHGLSTIAFCKSRCGFSLSACLRPVSQHTNWQPRMMVAWGVPTSWLAHTQADLAVATAAASTRQEAVRAGHRVCAGDPALHRAAPGRRHRRVPGGVQVGKQGGQMQKPGLSCGQAGMSRMERLVAEPVDACACHEAVVGRAL